MPDPGGTVVLHPRQCAGTGLAALAAVALLAGCASGPPAAPQATPAAPTGADGPSVSGSAATPGGPQPQADTGEPRVLATGLATPWALSFLPDGNALVTERDSARILRVSAQGDVTPVGVVEGVQARGEGGLLGIAVSPGFATDRRVLVYYTAGGENRIVALTAAEDGTIDGAAQQPVLDGIPAGTVHNGGELAFGPDGLLYVGTGESGDRARSQDPADLGGKILRLSPDGTPAPGNPSGGPVFATGIRNSQGIAFGPDGAVYASEFGANTADELNRIVPGGNYGWPEVEGAGGDDRFVAPLLTWPTDEASPSGLAQAGGSLWMSALRGERLFRIPLRDDGAVGAPQELLTGYGRIRGVAAAPDGSALWVTTSNRDGRGSPAADDDRIVIVPLR
ncbi:PQQ-dependent sugar dehydrogenase [Pseudonocardia nantongensis]|uniref:PQQ-dependent sugar dehydrogenase n=1 Tax=Pseudonocardia nantongensis TaxID=1181885 RepID=UPI003979522A